MMKVENR